MSEKKMTAADAEAAYAKRFGGFPYFLFMGADPAEIVQAVTEALRTGKMIEPPETEALY